MDDVIGYLIKLKDLTQYIIPNESKTQSIKKLDKMIDKAKNGKVNKLLKKKDDDDEE